MHWSLQGTPTRTDRARQFGQQAANRARRARREAVVLVPLITGVLLAHNYRMQLFGLDLPVRVATAVALVALGWALARDIGRAAGPALLARLDPATAGTAGFLIRLFALGLAVLGALQVAGLDPRTLALGGAAAAVVLGLAAQQTLGNLIAGIVLLSARAFKVGDQVRLQGGGLAGQVEGEVTSLGLLYTTLAREDSMLVPNNIVLGSAVVPLREPASVDLRARLRPGVKPSDIQALLDSSVTTATRSHLHIGLEEMDADNTVVRIAATPAKASEGPGLADEIMAVRAGVTQARPSR